MVLMLVRGLVGGLMGGSNDKWYKFLRSLDSISNVFWRIQKDNTHVGSHQNKHIEIYIFK
jgi:hypothetical protein